MEKKNIMNFKRWKKNYCEKLSKIKHIQHYQYKWLKSNLKDENEKKTKRNSDKEIMD